MSFIRIFAAWRKPPMPRSAVWWLMFAGLGCPAYGHGPQEVYSFISVDASPGKMELRLTVDLDWFEHYSNSDLDSDGDGEIPPEELSLHHWWVERYCQRNLLFLWDGLNHRPSLRDMRIAPASPPWPPMLVLELRAEGYNPARPFAIVSSLLGDASRASTVAVIRLPDRTEAFVLTDEAYYASDAPPDRPVSAGDGSKRRATARRGRIVAVGDGHVEVLCRAPDNEVILYVLGPDRSAVAPIDPGTVKALIKTADADADAPLSLQPVEAARDEQGGCYEFVGRSPLLKEMKDFQLDLSFKQDGKPRRTVFHVAADQAFMQSDVRICPNCPGVASDRPGFRCTRCGATVVAVRGGRLPYADHIPQHGGQFFAATDGYHHVEGALRRPSEFRLYLYDRDRRPTNPTELTITGKAGSPGTPPEGAADLTFRRSADNAYWLAPLPDALGLPTAVDVAIDFRNRRPVERFSFLFAESAEGSP